MKLFYVYSGESVRAPHEVVFNELYLKVINTKHNKKIVTAGMHRTKASVSTRLFQNSICYPAGINNLTKKILFYYRTLIG